MDKASLEKALKDTNSRFEDFSQQKSELNKQLEEVNTELVRLQGEYRGYDKLLNELKEPKNAKTSR